MGASANSNNLKNGYPTPGPQTPSGQDVMNHVFFMSQTEWKNAREENNYDLVIIGTGFCAYATARRALERDPFCRILIIERGPFFLPEHFQNLPLPFVNTLGGLSETFPWTLSSKTAEGPGTIKWQHGMIPFFGGRSTMWSAWCPKPTEDEMDGWPQATINAAKNNFESAEKLLRVQMADEIDANRTGALLELIRNTRPVYGELQKEIQTRLAKYGTDVEGIYRTQAAPLASAAENVDGIDFQKYAIPGELLQLGVKQEALVQENKGARMDIVADCVVEKIYQQDGQATALQTSRGVLPLGKAKLVLAMGTLPPATLVRNSFPNAVNPGTRFSAHFITSIVARVPKKDYKASKLFGELEIGACYIAGTDNDYKKQYHIQLSVLADEKPIKNAGTALRYMPDVVATASMAQLLSSEDHVVFVCAVLGELDSRNKNNWFLNNPQDENITTNSLLQITENDSDKETWDAMDKATFEVIEDALSPNGSSAVEYWHGDPDSGTWEPVRPLQSQIRVDALVHESSTLYIGEEETAPVDLNYRLRNTENVYVTGGALWPQGGSWNPTMTMVALAQDLADKLVPQESANKQEKVLDYAE
ncbi:GMC oxidoreductase [Aquimarina sp. I32.4]|uniref:GMC oxidoreductase n=1 Tax=Aquimarina sp. I32.4 TaxID=2053903 RepID=UPI0018EC1928|nr:GMC oxidoreductase [Aquimarina sp. I32.4]